MLVLAVTSLVGLIGLSSLAAVRVQHAGSRGRNEAVAAQHLADAALRLAHARLTADVKWRTAYTHGTWTADEPLGRGTVRFRLTDEADGDLADDDGPVRITARAAVGGAVRLVSVELRERFTPAATSLGPELLANADMEGSAWAYSRAPYSGVRLDFTNDSPHGGQKVMRASGRSSARAGPYQGLGSQLIAGETYLVDAWARVASSAETVRLGFFTVSNNDGLLERNTVAVRVTTAWTRVAGEIIADNPGGGLNELVWGVDTQNNAVDFYLDDASLRRVVVDEPTTTTLHVVRTTYRREMDG